MNYKTYHLQHSYKLGVKHCFLGLGEHHSAALDDLLHLGRLDIA